LRGHFAQSKEKKREGRKGRKGREKTPLPDIITGYGLGVESEDIGLT